MNKLDEKIAVQKSLQKSAFKELYQKAAEIIAAELKIPSSVKITIGLAPIKGNTYGHVKLGIGQMADFKMTLNKKVGSDMIIHVIGHELTHVAQILRGDLEFKADGLYWKGKATEYTQGSLDHDVAAYKELPWEKEAYGNMKPMYNKVKAAMKDYELFGIKIFEMSRATKLNSVLEKASVAQLTGAIDGEKSKKKSSVDIQVHAKTGGLLGVFKTGKKK